MPKRYAAGVKPVVFVRTVVVAAFIAGGQIEAAVRIEIGGDDGTATTCCRDLEVRQEGSRTCAVAQQHADRVRAAVRRHDVQRAVGVQVGGRDPRGEAPVRCTCVNVRRAALPR